MSSLNLITVKRLKRKLIFPDIKSKRRRRILNISNVIEEKYLASGSFGKIYSAKLLSPRFTTVAIKKVAISENDHISALKEAEILRKLCHANIVSIYDIIHNQREGEIWIIMEFLNGGSLRSYCTGDAYLSFSDKLKVSRDCWSALSYLHNEAKVTHKDIKPENILLHRKSTGNVFAKLCDFGLAKITETVTKTQLASVTGTAMYFPPEYVDSIRNPEKADVYSMGASLCELYSNAYFWCYPETDKPMAYPQIIAKLLTIWKQMKKGTVNKSNVPACLEKIECKQIQEYLSFAVAFDRRMRPTAKVFLNYFWDMMRLQN